MWCVVHHVVSWKVCSKGNTDGLLLLDLSGALSASLLLALALLQEGLGDEDLVLGGNGTASTQVST